MSHLEVYNSLVKFNGHLDVYFSDIDVTWLKRYESWLRSNGSAENTIGKRFRTLRAVFNLAIEQRVTKAEYYPANDELHSNPQVDRDVPHREQ
jgi:hypothetical protein